MNPRLLALVPILALAAPAAADTPKLDGKLDGRWCEPDAKVGCYSFKGKTVTEEAIDHSLASKGTWEQDDDMLILTFKEGPWSLQIVKVTTKVMILKDLSRKLTYTFTKR